MEERTLTVRRTFRSSPERVFEAWTSPDRLKKWWGPGEVRCPVAEVDLRPGGAYRLANEMPDGSMVWIVGTFETITPPELLTYSWRVEPGSGQVERVTVQFLAAGAGTEVVIVHERVASEAALANHQLGWVGCLDKLDTVLGSPSE